MERPNSLAIYSWDGEINYMDLDLISSHYASYLEEKYGICGDSRVAIIAEKSISTVVALVSILKTRSAFLLLEPQQPLQRLAKISADGKFTLCISSKDIAHLFVDIFQTLEVLPSYETLRHESKRARHRAPSVSPDENDVAYIIYTSGSTGQPKGILVEHRQLSAMCYYSGQILGMGPHVRMFQFSSWAFDAYIFETIAPLVHGGCVCIPSISDRLNNTVSSMNTMEVNYALFTPSFLQTIHRESVTSLKVLVIGGEKAGKRLVNNWSLRTEVFLVYGPAECCVSSSWLHVNKVDFTEGSIGTPVGCKFWIVREDSETALAPSGMVGELVIEGHNVARHYIPAETAPKGAFFQPGRVIGDQYLRLRSYQTGDLVRCQANGEIIFMGRKDTQTKLRGQRLDLREVEYYLQSLLPERYAAAVEVLRHANGSEHLVAFVVAGTTMSASRAAKPDEHQQNDTSPSEMSSVFDQLSQFLPGYMLPSRYITLPAMPLTHTGKLDRRALRQYSLYSASNTDSSAGNGNAKREAFIEREERLRTLWAKTLGTTIHGEFHPDSHFFQCAGDSISAIKLVALARADDLMLTVEQIFKYPILRDMATCLKHCNSTTLFSQSGTSNMMPEGSMPTLDPNFITPYGLRQDDIEAVFPCTPAQEFYVDISTHYDWLLDHHAYLAEQFVFELPRIFNIDRLKDAWSSVAVANASLRTRIIRNQQNFHLQIATKSLPCWTSESSLTEYLARDMAQPFTYGEVLNRLAYVTQGNGEQFVVWTAHHATYDGWSIHMLTEEICHVYDGGSVQQRPSMQEFVGAIRAINYTKSVAFWKAHLKDIQCRPFFPTSPDRSFFMEKASSIRMGIPKHQPTIFTFSTIIHATWALLIGKYTKAPDVAFHLSRSGRDFPMPGVDRILGPTVSRHPFRVRAEPNRTISELLTEIRDDLSSLSEHQFCDWRALRSPETTNEDIERATRCAILLGVHPTLTRDGAKKSSRVLHLKTAGRFQNHPVPVLLECNIGQDDLLVKVTYDPSVYEDQRIQRMLQQFQEVLQMVSTNCQSQKLLVYDVQDLVFS